MDVVFHRKKGEKGQSKPFHNIYTCQEVKKGIPPKSVYMNREMSFRGRSLFHSVNHPLCE